MDELTDKVSILCQELGLELPRPNAQGEFALRVDALELRIFVTKSPHERLVLLASLGTVAQWMEDQGHADAAQLLSYVMRLHAARVKQLGLECILTLEDETLLLWQSLDPYAKVPDFLLAVETLLNEAEYWHQKFNAATV